MISPILDRDIDRAALQCDEAAAIVRDTDAGEDVNRTRGV
jgi:hypothetical protein